MVATFTDSYSTADLELDRDSSRVNGTVSEIFQVYLQSRNKETARLDVLGGSVSNQPGYLACTHLKRIGNEFAALDSICLVFYRTGSMMQRQSWLQDFWANFVALNALPQTLEECVVKTC